MDIYQYTDKLVDVDFFGCSENDIYMYFCKLWESFPIEDHRVWMKHYDLVFHLLVAEKASQVYNALVKLLRQKAQGSHEDYSSKAHTICRIAKALRTKGKTTFRLPQQIWNEEAIAVSRVYNQG